MRASWELGLTATYATAARAAAEVLRAKAEEGPRLVLNLRCARWGDGLVLDLGHPDSARCVVVTADGWEIREEPPEGVLFRRTSATLPLPDPARGVAPDDGLAELRDLVGMTTEKDDRWLLVRGWLVAVILPDVPRPLLSFLGPAGSAKTSRAWMVVSVLDPKPDGKLGSSFGKNLSDDQVKALAHYLVAYDNLGSVSEAVSDHLARVVTGDSAERRKLYTDDELAAVNYRRSGVFTAITLPPVQPDTLARLVPIACSYVPEELRRPEAELWQRWHDAHPRMLGAVLGDAVTMLRRLPEVREKEQPLPRMADYFLALQAVDPLLAEAYVRATDEAMSTAAEGDPSSRR
jgi:hypothetical protein